MHRSSRHTRLGLTMMAIALASCSITAAGTATADNVEGTSAPRAPVQYRVKEKSLIGNDLHEAGATVSYAGLPSENLEPLCDEGRKRAAEYQASNTARVKQMISSTAGENTVGDPAVFMKAFAEEMARERAEHQAQIAALVATNQESAVLLAEAAKNMALLAASIAVPAAVLAAPETPAAPAADATTGTADAKDVASTDTPAAPAKRTRG